MATVKHVTLEDGSHAIGVGDGKKFVPFSTVDADRYKQLEDNEYYTAPKSSGDQGKDKGDKGKGGES